MPEKPFVPLLPMQVNYIFSLSSAGAGSPKLNFNGTLLLAGDTLT